MIPSGGLVLWIKIPNANTERLATKLSQQNVYVKPGKMFTTTKLYQDCLRINIGQIPNEDLYAQLALLCQLAHDEVN